MKIGSALCNAFGGGISHQGIFQIQVMAQRKKKKQDGDDKQQLHRTKKQGFSLQCEAFWSV